MSYRNKVIALSATLACLLLIYAAGLFFSPERLRDRADSGRLLAGKAADAAELSIAEGAGSPLRFKKDQGAWSLEEEGSSLPVESSRVEALLSSLASVESLSLRSETQASWKDFSLDETRAKRLVVKSASGKVLADFYAGSYGPTGTELYVRLAGKAPVYAAKADFGSYLEGSRASWLSRALFKEGPKPEDVQSIDYSSSLSLQPGAQAKKVQKALSWSATRSGGSWTVKGAALSGQTVDAILRSALSLEGDDMVVVAPPEAFQKIEATLRFHLGSGKSLSLEVGGTTPSGLYYARSPSSPYVFELSTYSLSSVLR